MIRADIQIVGLDAVRRIASQTPRVLDSELRPAIRESAAIIRGHAIHNARAFALSGRLPASIRYHVTNLSATIGSMAATALSIEQGRKPGEVVKLGLIRAWVEKKGLVRGVFSIQTQKIARRLSAKRRAQDSIGDEERRLAASIVELIRRQGTKPHAFLIPAVEQSKQKVNDRFKKAVEKTLQRVTQRAA